MSLRACVVSLLFLIPVTHSETQFKITSLQVPEHIDEGKAANIECSYDADFTTLRWFKGNKEFFKYKPGPAPTTTTHEASGVGAIEVVECGLTTCHLKLSGLTEEASGMYRCDLEREQPPYKFADKFAQMTVRGSLSKHINKELDLSMGSQYSEGDLIEARCNASKDNEIRWYLNGKEEREFRNKTVLRLRASKFYFPVMYHEMAVQCAQFHNGRILGSKTARAKWKEAPSESESHNGSSGKTFEWLSVFNILVMCFVVILGC